MSSISNKRRNLKYAIGLLFTTSKIPKIPDVDFKAASESRAIILNEPGSRARVLVWTTELNCVRGFRDDYPNCVRAFRVEHPGLDGVDEGAAATRFKNISNAENKSVWEKIGFSKRVNLEAPARTQTVPGFALKNRLPRDSDAPRTSMECDAVVMIFHSFPPHVIRTRRILVLIAAFGTIEHRPKRLFFVNTATSRRKHEGSRLLCIPV